MLWHRRLEDGADDFSAGIMSIDISSIMDRVDPVLLIDHSFWIHQKAHRDPPNSFDRLYPATVGMKSL